MVDRIDYNIEHAHMRVEEGLKHLQKAEQYQKKDRKMHCILILAVIVIILLFVLIITKTWQAPWNVFFMFSSIDTDVLIFSFLLTLSDFGNVFIYSCLGITGYSIYSGNLQNFGMGFTRLVALLYL